MSALTSLRGTASAFGGEALENWAIQRAARHWGIFKIKKPQSQPTKTTPSRKNAQPSNKQALECVLSAAHVTSLQIEEKSSICTAPQEDTSFTSYNKVASPFTATIRMICDGSETGNLVENLLPGFLRGAINNAGPDAVKKDFIKTLKELVKDTNLYYVVTPERNYKNANIIDYKFTRSTDNNTADLIMVDITLQEVRQTVKSLWADSQKPQGAVTKNIGMTNLSPQSA